MTDLIGRKYSRDTVTCFGKACLNTKRAYSNFEVTQHQLTPYSDHLRSFKTFKSYFTVHFLRLVTVLT